MNKAVFLDRDGTINIDKGYVCRKDDFEYIQGVIPALIEIQKAGYLLIIVTNQSGIARGYFTEKEYYIFEDWMLSDLKNRGVNISKIYHCPHYENGSVLEYSIQCNCRKPKTELFWKAQKEFDINMERSFAIGDKQSDLTICSESGVKGILLNSNSIQNNMIEAVVCHDWQEIKMNILHEQLGSEKLGSDPTLAQDQ